MKKINLKKLKQKGLKHRFERNDLDAWYFWHKCLWCGENKWDAMHHIISPSSHYYHDLPENSSILNSCPIHNSGCHLDNPRLHKLEYEIKLLEKTSRALELLGYKLKEIDHNFFQAYYHPYFKNINYKEIWKLK